ncbi:hypothetical protein ACIPY6_06510 [Streptomyces sp. NPDC090054]|uniref:hypothetical protein n=1 Tax=Streptomyces sp. NPDC090054 TaxID=3365933 RepID=UPI003805FA71
MPAPLRLLSAQRSFLTDLHRLEEPLLIRLEHTARHDRTAPGDVWRLPAGLDGEAPRTALINIHRAPPKPPRQEMYALDEGRTVAGATASWVSAAPSSRRCTPSPSTRPTSTSFEPGERNG